MIIPLREMTRRFTLRRFYLYCLLRSYRHHGHQRCQGHRACSRRRGRTGNHSGRCPSVCNGLGRIGIQSPVRRLRLAHCHAGSQHPYHSRAGDHPVCSALRQYTPVYSGIVTVRPLLWMCAHYNLSGHQYVLRLQKLRTQLQYGQHIPDSLIICGYTGGLFRHQNRVVHLNIDNALDILRFGTVSTSASSARETGGF